MAFNAYQEITNKILDKLREGNIPWQCPYNLKYGRFAVSRATGKRYSLINQFMLNRKGVYFTFKQAQKEGFKVRKGAKAEHVYFWKMLTFSNSDKDATLEPEQGEAVRTIPYLKYYNVFHQDDIEGFETEALDVVQNNDCVGSAEDIINNYIGRDGAPLFKVDDASIPCYSPSEDTIFCPSKCNFVNISEYYKTIFHECVHSTGAKSRLDRDLSGSMRNIGGREKYSREELVAEMGSAFLSGYAQLQDDSIDNQAAYIRSWMGEIENNPRMFVWASAKAEAAVQYILGELEQGNDGCVEQ